MSHLIFVLVGAVLVGSGWMLWQGRVPPNPIMGLRLPRTLRDREAWYLANGALGRAMTLGGALTAALAFAAFLADRGGGNETLRVLLIAVLLATVLTGGVWGYLAMGREKQGRGAG